MRKLLTFCLLQLAVLTAYAGYWDDEIWTCGEEMLCTRKLNDTQVLLIANGYFDAGYGYLLEVEQKGDGIYDMTQIGVSQLKSIPEHLDLVARTLIDEDAVNSTSAGTKWKRREVGNYSLLLRYNDEGKLWCVYRESGRDLFEDGSDAIKELLVGQYTSSQSRRFAFSLDDTCIWNGTAGQSYAMVCDGDIGTPSTHFMVGDSQYEFRLTADGLLIYNTYHRQDAEGPFTGTLYATLAADDSAPRWAYLSDRPLLMPAIYAVDAQIARLMRNEIYARHGYRFADAQLRAYFESCSWYHPVADNSMVKLTPMEQINVELLKNNR